MKLSDISSPSDIKKPSSGLADPNKSAHAMKQRGTSGDIKNKKSAPCAPVKIPELKVPEPAKREPVVVEPMKRFKVTDFVKLNF